MALTALFLLKEYESELLRQENFSDIYGTAVPYMFKVEVYTCVSFALRGIHA